MSFKSMLPDAYFNLGYNDVKNNNGFSKEYDTWSQEKQEGYERGRHYFCATNGMYPPKNGKTVLVAAQYMLSDAYRNRLVI